MTRTCGDTETSPFFGRCCFLLSLSPKIIILEQKFALECVYKLFKNGTSGSLLTFSCVKLEHCAYVNVRSCRIFLETMAQTQVKGSFGVVLFRHCIPPLRGRGVIISHQSWCNFLFMQHICFCFCFYGCLKLYISIC